jgi:hypothetical protein
MNVPKLHLKHCYFLIHVIFIFLGRFEFVFVYLMSVCLALIGGISYALRQGNGDVIQVAVFFILQRGTVL